MTRQIAAFIAGGYMTEGENPAVEAAQKLGMDDIEIALLQAGPAAEAPKENRDGSYERLMAFGTQEMTKG
jgi:hypothetical protein